VNFGKTLFSGNFGRTNPVFQTVGFYWTALKIVSGF
jgi:hypothetical protein